MNRNLIIEKEIKDFNKLDVVLENTEKLKSYIQSRIEKIDINGK